jgi:hypothetical protein
MNSIIKTILLLVLCLAYASSAKTNLSKKLNKQPPRSSCPRMKYGAEGGCCYTTEGGMTRKTNKYECKAKAECTFRTVTMKDRAGDEYEVEECNKA